MHKCAQIQLTLFEKHSMRNTIRKGSERLSVGKIVSGAKYGDQASALAWSLYQSLFLMHKIERDWGRRSRSERWSAEKIVSVSPVLTYLCLPWFPLISPDFTWVHLISPVLTYLCFPWSGYVMWWTIPIFTGSTNCNKNPNPLLYPPLPLSNAPFGMASLGNSKLWQPIASEG